MTNSRFSLIILVLITIFTSLTPSSSTFAATQEGEKIYKKNCKSCHQISEPGAFRPLIELTSDAEKIKKAVREGVEMMPPYKDKFNDAQLQSLVEYMQSVQKQ